MTQQQGPLTSPCTPLWGPSAAATLSLCQPPPSRPRLPREALCRRGGRQKTGLKRRRRRRRRVGDIRLQQQRSDYKLSPQVDFTVLGRLFTG
ncbi:unnamed protein product [Pleuronectes platessa]|uniref:Uncharacterized protein n=1 Tax=Pleuronectes platessa TaxID=8262 RepID=A0A9N7USP6_PLEPL|nr:unnamed protein product [Pleuronectes platessa]